MATSKRGFASMDAAKQREIASKGGRAAHAKRTAHEFTSDEARVAGRNGGEAVSRDRAHMAAIGREGDHSRGARARAAATGQNISSPSTSSDVAQSTGNQPLVRQANDDRSGFDASRQQERNLPRNERNERTERNDEDRGNNGPLSSRDRI